MESRTIPGRAVKRQALQIALQALYEHDAAKHPVGAVVDRLGRQPDVPEEVGSHARELVAGTAANLTAIDAMISDAAPTWPISQMARVDKNVLRLAIYEAFVDNAAQPVRAAINDAIELAKTFGTDSSSKFVNGVLATLAERRPQNLEG